MVIYVIQNIVNDKCYIGQTRNKFEYRKNSHIKKLTDSTHRNTYLENSWNKYGKDAFEFKILEDGFNTINELNEAEIFWIQYLQTTNKKFGYNLDYGGGVKTKRSKETVEKITKKLKKKIAQYSLDGNLLNIYKSRKEASRKTNVSVSNIGSCVLRKTESAGGFQWRYYSTSPEKKIPKVKTNIERMVSKTSKRVALYNLDGKFIRTYNSYKEAGKDLGVKPRTVSKTCNQKRCLLNKYQARSYLYNENYPDTISKIKSSYERSGESNSIGVATYNKNGELVNLYKTKNECCKKLGITKSALEGNIYGHTKLTNGLQFKTFKNKPKSKIGRVKQGHSGVSVQKVCNNKVIKEYKSVRDASDRENINYDKLWKSLDKGKYINGFHYRRK